ncbi:hypothetical protein EON65_34150 [archaeon]|nr:MAG: hypothetical protein EON65_34150 [archaeon]
MSSFNLNAIQDYSPDQILKGNLLLQVVFVVCYLISALFIASNTYAGFNSLLLGIIIIAVIGLSYYGLFKEVTRTLFGIVLGCSVMLIFMTLQSAIFWGQYSDCTPNSLLNSVTQCYNPAAMKSCCTFSVFLFLTYIAQVAAMIRYKNDVLGAAPSNEAVGSRDGIPVFTLPLGLRSYTAPVYSPVPNPVQGADNNSGYVT